MAQSDPYIKSYPYIQLQFIIGESTLADLSLLTLQIITLVRSQESVSSIRDESFITRWGGRLYSGGVGIFFWWCTGGVENKNPLGQGGHIFHQEFGGSDVFHWFLLSLKVKASGGPSPPDPPYPKWYCLQYQIFKIKKRLQNKLMYCGVTM